MDTELFKNLADQLTEAVKKSDAPKVVDPVVDAPKVEDPKPEINVAEEVQKAIGSAVSDLGVKIDAIAKALAPGREAKDEDKGEEPGAIVKAITDLSANGEVTRDALEKVLARIEALEKGSVVRKSVAGADEGDKGTDKGTPEEQEKLRKAKGTETISAGLVHLAKNPGSSLTLV